MVSDFILSLLYDLLQLGQLDGPESFVQCEFHGWLQPELGFAIRRKHMHMHARLLSRKEVKPVISISKNRRTHTQYFTKAQRPIQPH
jgi:hypothetical protein